MYIYIGLTRSVCPTGAVVTRSGAVACGLFRYECLCKCLCKCVCILNMCICIYTYRVYPLFPLYRCGGDALQGRRVPRSRSRRRPCSRSEFYFSPCSPISGHPVVLALGVDFALEVRSIVVHVILFRALAGSVRLFVLGVDLALQVRFSGHALVCLSNE